MNAVTNDVVKYIEQVKIEFDESASDKNLNSQIKTNLYYITHKQDLVCLNVVKRWNCCIGLQKIFIKLFGGTIVNDDTARKRVLLGQLAPKLTKIKKIVKNSLVIKLDTEKKKKIHDILTHLNDQLGSDFFKESLHLLENATVYQRVDDSIYIKQGKTIQPIQIATPERSSFVTNSMLWRKIKSESKIGKADLESWMALNFDSHPDFFKEHAFALAGHIRAKRARKDAIFVWTPRNHP